MSLNEALIQSIIKLQLRRVQERIYENHIARLTYDDSLIAYVLEACTETIIGARSIEQLLHQQILPELSRQFLLAMSAGQQVKNINIAVNEQGRITYQCDLKRNIQRHTAKAELLAAAKG